MRKVEIIAIVLVFMALVPFPMALFYYHQSIVLQPGEITLVAKQSEFVPSEITVKRGEVVKLFVTSEDVPHSLLIRTSLENVVVSSNGASRITENEVEVTIMPGKPVRIEFVAENSGEFTFRCGVVCSAVHEEHMEMKGKLIVQV